MIGVSTDKIESQRDFIRRFKLNHPMLSDVQKKMVKAFGVWKPKKFMGREFLGTQRTTFILGPDGRIRKIFRNVKPRGHAREVRETLAAMRSQ